MSWLLFLDDDARKGGMESFRYPPDDTWTIATSSAEAIRLIKLNGPPGYISFDHDLGEGEGGYVDTAMNVINYLTEHHYDSEINYDVHSRNPEGKKNIISKMESWKKSKEL